MPKKCVSALAACLLGALWCAGLPAEEPIDQQPYRYGGLEPDEAAARLEAAEDLRVEQVLAEPLVAQPVFLNFDERGRMWVVEYRQYPHPAGLKIVSHDRFWRSVYDRVPEPPPHHVPGKDRITIHEDTDGDGTYDQHKVFVDGLNIVTAVERGRGGVWVLNPPYLLFYPDADNNDVPDSDPHVVLSGFGLEDTHSVVNSLRWGPDGWLYGAQGSTVTAQVVVSGRGEPPVFSQGQGIWRYHPEQHRYEIFAEGGGNAFGVEIDAQGRIFSGHNGGNTRGFHYVQGGYLRKGFDKHGPLSNPYAFGFFEAMPHQDVERFTHNFVIYQARELPERYWGKLIGIEPLQGRLVLSDLQRWGSTFRTHDIERILTSDDDWFRPVDIKVGPDGCIYVADWYDGQINHYMNHQGELDPTNGRIYRLSAAGRPLRPLREDLGALTTDQLIDRLASGNKWIRQTALRILGDRRDRSARGRLRRELAQCQGDRAIDYLWGLHLSGGLEEQDLQLALAHTQPAVRAWAVRLVGDQRAVTRWQREALLACAEDEPDVEVRTQLACSARRLPVADGLAIVQRLLGYEEDEKDPYQPLLLWWAVESCCTRDPQQVVQWVESSGVWELPLFQSHLAARLMRRFAQSARQQDFQICQQLLGAAPRAELAKKLVEGFQQGIAARPGVPLPESLVQKVLEVVPDSFDLRLRLAEPQAVQEAIGRLDDPAVEAPRRAAWIRLLTQAGLARTATEALIGCLTQARDQRLLDAAAVALGQVPAPEIPTRLLGAYPSLPAPSQRAVQAVLVSRPAWALQLLQAADREAIDPLTLSVEFLRRARDLEDPSINRILESRWGDLREIPSDEALALVERLSEVLQDQLGDPYRGKPLFQEHCGKCHRLFGQGGDVGPDLTSYDRSNLESMLLSIVQPSAEIREGYENYQVVTEEGRVVSGMLAERLGGRLVLRTPEGTVSVETSGEAEVRLLSRSIMPDGLLGTLADDQLRDLFAYLRSTQPLLE